MSTTTKRRSVKSCESIADGKYCKRRKTCIWRHKTCASKHHTTRTSSSEHHGNGDFTYSEMLSLATRETDRLLYYITDYYTIVHADEIRDLMRSKGLPASDKLAMKELLLEMVHVFVYSLYQRLDPESKDMLRYFVEQQKRRDNNGRSDGRPRRYRKRDIRVIVHNLQRLIFTSYKLKNADAFTHMFRDYAANTNTKDGTTPAAPPVECNCLCVTTLGTLFFNQFDLLGNRYIYVAWNLHHIYLSNQNHSLIYEMTNTEDDFPTCVREQSTASNAKAKERRRRTACGSCAGVATSHFVRNVYVTADHGIIAIIFILNLTQYYRDAEGLVKNRAHTAKINAMWRLCHRIREEEPSPALRKFMFVCSFGIFPNKYFKRSASSLQTNARQLLPVLENMTPYNLVYNNALIMAETQIFQDLEHSSDSDAQTIVPLYYEQGDLFWRNFFRFVRKEILHYHYYHHSGGDGDTSDDDQLAIANATPRSPPRTQLYNEMFFANTTNFQYVYSIYFYTCMQYLHLLIHRKFLEMMVSPPDVSLYHLITVLLYLTFVSIGARYNKKYALHGGAANTPRQFVPRVLMFPYSSSSRHIAVRDADSPKTVEQVEELVRVLVHTVAALKKKNAVTPTISKHYALGSLLKYCTATLIPMFTARFLSRKNEK